MIAYLPLDSRPCNALFPVQLAAMCGAEVLTPPQSALDWFDRPSAFPDKKTFLIKAAERADALVVSAEQLCFGSLVASREPDVSKETALDRLALLRDIKRSRPELPITVFAVVMRTAGSNYSDADIARNALITAYSIASHKGDERELARLRALIPEKALADYLSVRARNHAVNRTLVELLHEGVIDRLLLSQEDCQPYGLHKQEQEALICRIRALALGDRAALHNGADEAGCLCIARVLKTGEYRLGVRYLRDTGGAFTALYEDRPFDENVTSQCAFLGIRRVDAPPYDGVLLIDTPKDGIQTESALAGEAAPDADDERCAELLAESVRAGVPTGFLDVRCANGGTGEVLEAFSKQACALSLQAYSAWNTASNSLGTALAQMVLGKDVQKNARFTLERLLDDHAYQAVVRPAVNAALRDAGRNCLRLDDVNGCERMIRERMDAYIARSPIFRNMPDFTYDMRLPWPRTFEILIEAQ